MLKYFDKAHFLLLANQFVTYGTAFLSIPYLTRILGPDNFGKITYVTVIIIICNFLTDFGLTFSGTKLLARCGNDHNEKAKLFSLFWSIQWVLTIVVIIIFTIYIVLFERNDILASYLILGIPLIFTSVLYPIWFFNGISSFSIYSKFQVSIRIIQVLLFFIFVKTSVDSIRVIIINSLTSFLGGVFLIYWIFNYEVKYIRPTFDELIFGARLGLNNFAISITTAIYSMIIPVVIGFSGKYDVLAFYSLGDKIRGIGSALSSPFLQVIYPKVTSLKKDFKIVFDFVLKQSYLILFLTVAFGLFVFVTAGEIVELLGGKGFIRAIPVIKIMSFVPTVVVLSNLLGVQILLTMGYDKMVLGVTSFVAFLSPFITYIMLRTEINIAGGLTLLLLELLICVSFIVMIYKLKKKHHEKISF
jgi:O-antigen/teichoic acid export membrane protein